jgi:uncharacterized protein (DUF1919 family)
MLYKKFVGIFTVLTFLYNMEFYLQHVLQFNYNVCVYALVILPTFKISTRQIPIVFYSVLGFLMIESRSVGNLHSSLSK